MAYLSLKSLSLIKSFIEDKVNSVKITVDSTLSSDSTNPVQNKVINTALDTKANKTDIPTKLPANGGNADTVNNLTVETAVPANAVFTDTVYTHPKSGVTAGTYKSVTVDANGHVTAGTNPTTISGYGITDAYTKAEVNSQISTIPKFAIAVVTALPTENISNTTVYLVKTGSESQNLYTEYIYVTTTDATSGKATSTWEKLGTQTVDLSGYLTKTDAASTYLGKTANAVSATTATKVGITTVGSVSTPVYINAGTPTVCTSISVGTITATTALNIPGGKIWIE